MKHLKKFLLFFSLIFSILLISKTSNLETFANSIPKDFSIEDLFWHDTNVKIEATWSEATDKTSYRVKLFRNKKAITNFLNTNVPSYDFTKEILANGTGDYTFSAYPQKLGLDSQKSSEKLRVDSEFLEELRRNNRDLVSQVNREKREKDLKKKQQKADNKTGKNKNTKSNSNANPLGPAAFIKNNTKKVSTANTPAESEGSFLQENGNWYFVDKTNNRATNDWRFVKGNWYFFKEDSTMKTGWLEWNSLWYYLDNDGKMLTNTTTPDGYKVDEKGVWIK